MSNPSLILFKRSALTKATQRGTLILKRNAAKKIVKGDPQNDLIRRAMYPSNIRNKETPTGTWRPDVAHAIQRAIPSVQAHETIERAWLLHQRRARKQREEESSRKFASMERAMDELEKTNPFLYTEATRTEDPRHRTPEEIEKSKKLRGIQRKMMESKMAGLFPREMRLPTDTPPRAGWNYDWKAPSSSSSCKLLDWFVTVNSSDISDLVRRRHDPLRYTHASMTRIPYI